MRFVLLIVCALVISVNGFTKEIIDRVMKHIDVYGETCMEESKANSDDVTQIISRQIPESHEGKCLIFCFLRNFKLLNNEGLINYEGVSEFIGSLDNTEIYKKIMEICAGTDKKSEDACDRTADVSKCLLDNLKVT